MLANAEWTYRSVWVRAFVWFECFVTPTNIMVFRSIGLECPSTCVELWISS